jgi:hypothetical protein
MCKNIALRNFAVRITKKTQLILVVTGGYFIATICGANAKTYLLVAYLSGSAAVPPNNSDAFGEARFTYDSDTRRLDYLVTYGGLSTAQVGIYGPAYVGQNAPVLIAFPTPDSPISGAVILSREQGAELLTGKLYVDAHGEGYANGEIRGQIERQ